MSSTWTSDLETMMWWIESSMRVSATGTLMSVCTASNDVMEKVFHEGVCARNNDVTVTLWASLLEWFCSTQWGPKPMFTPLCYGCPSSHSDVNVSKSVLPLNVCSAWQLCYGKCYRRCQPTADYVMDGRKSAENVSPLWLRPNPWFWTIWMGNCVS